MATRGRKPALRDINGKAIAKGSRIAYAGTDAKGFAVLKTGTVFETSRDGIRVGRGWHARPVTITRLDRVIVLA